MGIFINVYLFIIIFAICVGIFNKIKNPKNETQDLAFTLQPKPEPHYYTDEECINACFFFGKEGGYCGHMSLVYIDEDLEEEYTRILSENGRQALWNHQKERGYFKDDGLEYYGFFGKTESE